MVWKKRPKKSAKSAKHVFQKKIGKYFILDIFKMSKIGNRPINIEKKRVCGAVFPTMCSVFADFMKKNM